ncbi:hypothetical protein LO762_13655 [Actinocorallia sp. API 0066]|uniref:DUF7224 domain-containing protein n=1 Tax=Actinocorallia sp. API 0066 TaxID=2896846 RepID=UPI001E375B71|nr:hypothetical protein [Actinocorallia sp. API 0066]MCD0450230.1 hypothetical protein [Actinocorallia sp. API 0066]
MPVRRWLARHSVVLVSPVLLGLVLYLTWMGFAELGENWASGTSVAARSLVIVGPVGAALAAWEADRLRRVSAATLPSVRSWAAVVLWSLWPVVLLCAAALALALGTVAPRMTDVPGTPHLGMLTVAGAMTLGFVLAGFGLGYRLRASFSIPVLLIGGWVVLVYPVAIEPLWVRHVFAELNCCATDQVVNPRVVLAPLVAAAGLVAAALVSGMGRGGRARGLAAVASVAVAVAGAAALVHRLDYQAGLPRTAGLGCAATRGVTVCLWTEHERFRSRWAPSLTAAVERLAGAGLPAPERLTEGPPRSPQDWTFRVTGDATADDTVMALVAGMIPPMPTCATHGPWPGDAAIDPTGAWLALTAGLPADLVAQRISPEGVATAQRVRALDHTRQRAWFDRNLAAMRDCRTEPGGPA